MSKSLIDKIWFTDKTDCDVFVDFGCADGNLIKFLAGIFKNNIYIGYDISKDMIAKATENCSSLPNVILVNDLTQLKGVLKRFERCSGMCLILSSVIHEILSYSSRKDENDFWNFANSGLFDFIAVRDMDCSFLSEKVTNKIAKAVYANPDKGIKERLANFEYEWNTIDSNSKNLTHFLLKYRYSENWEREVYENYLPISPDGVKSRLTNYEVDYFDEYLLHYTRKKIMKDFNIDLSKYNAVTNYKLLLKLK